MLQRRAISTKPIMISGVACLLLLLQGCRGQAEETQTEIKNGDYKIIIRTQEFHHSGTVNAEVCVAHANDAHFPSKETQCFLHGYDFSNLTASWESPTELILTYRCGRVTRFTNSAFVYNSGPVPQEFYAFLNDTCTLHDRTGDTRQ